MIVKILYDINKGQGLLSDSVRYDVESPEDALEKFRELEKGHKYPLIFKQLGVMVIDQTINGGSK